MTQARRTEPSDFISLTVQSMVVLRDLWVGNDLTVVGDVSIQTSQEVLGTLTIDVGLVGDSALVVQVANLTQYSVLGSGTTRWHDGAGVADTVLLRLAANVLGLDTGDSFRVSDSGQFQIGGSTIAIERKGAGNMGVLNGNNWIIDASSSLLFTNSGAMSRGSGNGIVNFNTPAAATDFVLRMSTRNTQSILELYDVDIESNQALPANFSRFRLALNATGDLLRLIVDQAGTGVTPAFQFLRDANIALELSEPADGNVALLVRRNLGGTLTLQQVSMDAVDTASAGFRALRVPN